MVDVAPALDNLRQIHLPASPAGAGPTLLMAVLGSALSIVLCAALWTRFRRWRAVRRSALQALAATRRLEPAARLAAQAVVLRRLVKTLHGAGDARRRGRDWLACLDSALSTRFFTEAQGQIFGDALYRPLSGQDVEALDHALRQLFARIAK